MTKVYENAVRRAVKRFTGGYYDDWWKLWGKRAAPFFSLRVNRVSASQPKPALVAAPSMRRPALPANPQGRRSLGVGLRWDGRPLRRLGWLERAFGVLEFGKRNIEREQWMICGTMCVW